jgi:hypothetical protein
LSHERFMTRLTMALVAMLVAVGWTGAGTASAQTVVDTDFGGGTQANTEVVPPGDLALAPTFDISEEFNGMALPPGWEMFNGAPWTGGTATVAGGVLTVDGARANTTAFYDPSRSLDFAATFASQAFQHVGFGNTFEDAPWAMFSTGGGALALGLYARTFAPGPGGAAENTAIAGVDPLVQHDYSIEWTPTEVRYFVDGALVATHAIAITAQMRPVASDLTTGGGTVAVDYVDLYSYPTSGSFTSRVLDAGDNRATWRTLTAAVDAPAGTGVTFEARTGRTPSPDASWTAFQPVGPGGAVAGGVGHRYIQYRATLTTTDTSVTPFVDSVTMGYEVDTAGPATTISDVAVSGTAARVTFSSEAGATFQCSLDDGPFQACTSPREYTGLAPGAHRVRVRAIDQVGNVGPVAERTFVIARPNPPDNKPPKVRPKPRSVKVSDRGRFKVRLRCPSDEKRCHIMLRIRYRGETIASKRVTVRGGRTARVTLRLKPFARDLIETRRRLRVFALTTARDSAANRATTRTRMTLRASAR